VLAATCIAFAPALHGPQLFDDKKTIQDNPTIATLWPISVPLHPPAGTAVTGRPIVNLSLALNHGFNDLLGLDQRPDPDGVNKTVSYHLFNLAFHLFSGLLLLGIIRRTLRSGRFGEMWVQQADAVALAVTALWLLHPLQTDAVDYLIQRTELLVGLCYLATLYCSIRAWDSANATSSRRWYAAGAIACLLGMGSKEVMVGAPLLIVLYDRAFRAHSWRELGAAEYRDRRWFYAALVATLLLLVGLLAGTPRGVSIGFNAGMPWYEYLHSQGWAIAHYLRLVFWPIRLSLDYGSNAIAHWRGVPGLLLLSSLGGGTLFAWTRANRWGWLAFLGSWFFVTLAPSSSFVPIVTEIAAERRMYLPLAAVLVVVVVAGDTLARRLRLSSLLVVPVVVTVAALLAVLTFERSRMYRDPEVIWRDAVARVPGNARAWYNLGVALENLPVPHADEADADYREAVRIAPTYADPLLRIVIGDLGRNRYAEAKDELRHYPLETGNDTVLAGLGKVLFAAGDTAGALLVFERAVEQPSSVETLVNLGVLYLTIGRPADAAKTLRQAVEMAPSRTDLMVFLSGMLLEQKHADQALPYLEELVRRDPNSGVNLALLSLGYAGVGRSDDAIAQAGRAVQRGGEDERVYLFAGRAMLDNHRPDLAEGYLARAVTLDPKDADAVEKLAEAKAALAKKGR
jgi:tetratricopeptide (TPR) repeat protein